MQRAAKRVIASSSGLPIHRRNAATRGIVHSAGGRQIKSLSNFTPNFPSQSGQFSALCCIYTLMFLYACDAAMLLPTVRAIATFILYSCCTMSNVWKHFSTNVRYLKKIDKSKIFVFDNYSCIKGFDSSDVQTI